MDETVAAPDEEGGESPFASMDPETARHPQPMFKLLRDEMPVMPVENGVVVSRKVDVDIVGAPAWANGGSDSIATPPSSLRGRWPSSRSR